MDWLEVRFQILSSLRLEILLHLILILFIQLFVLLHDVLLLLSQVVNLFLLLGDLDVPEVALILEGLYLFSHQSDRILQLLRVAIPVFVLFHIFEIGKVE